jgi:CheY-like chemotaxis protein
MQQALVKIIENATQAVAKDGHIMIITGNKDVAEPTVEGSVTLPAGTYVSVEIWDNGCGIPTAVLPRIIEPFFTTKTGHRGLGLAWAYGITDLVMPNMSGRELIEQIHHLAPDTRTICSSGYVRHNGADEDEDVYLQKPFTSHDLLRKVKQALA